MRRMVLVAVVAMAVGCGDASLQAPQPVFAISDGAHGGNPHFFFLPPLVPSVTTTGTFNPSLRPTVTIAELLDSTSTACIAGPVVRTFTNVAASAQAYSVSWHTGDDALVARKNYRICVSASGRELGYRDIRPDASGADVPRNPDQSPIYEFNNGSTLPIKFLIETGALCTLEAIDCTDGVVGPAGDTLVCDDGMCGLGIPAGALDREFTFIVELKPCPRDGDGRVDLLPSGIPQFPGCLEITAEPDTEFVAFLAPVVVAACIDAPGLTPAQRERIQLHHLQDDGTVNSLPNTTADFVAAACESFQDQLASRTVAGQALHFAGRALRAAQKFVNPWFAPLPAYATDQGFGGRHTSCTTTSSSVAAPGAAFSVSATAGPSACGTLSPFVWALPSQMQRVGWTNPLQGDVGDVVNPTVRVTDEGGAAVADALVTFTVTVGDGPPTVPVAVRTDGSGLASVPWTLGPAGSNQLVVSGDGIGVAAVDGGTGPFAEHLGNPILLQTGQLPFNAMVCDAGPTANIGDGVINPGEYRESRTFPVKVSGGQTTATLYWTSDCHNLFIGLEVAASAQLQNGLRLVFDNDGDGGQAVGDDQWNVARNSKTGAFEIADRFLSSNCIGSRQSDCGTNDVAAGGTNDLSGGFVGYNAAKGVSVYEIRHPLNVDPGHDIHVNANTGGRIGVYVVLQLGNGAQGNNEYPGFRQYLPIIVPAGVP